MTGSHDRACDRPKLDTPTVASTAATVQRLRRGSKPKQAMNRADQFTLLTRHVQNQVWKCSKQLCRQVPPPSWAFASGFLGRLAVASRRCSKMWWLGSLFGKGQGARFHFCLLEFFAVVSAGSQQISSGINFRKCFVSF